MSNQAELATLTGKLPAELGNAVSDAIYAALSKGMEPDEACCVAITVVCDYARTAYGPNYLDGLAQMVLRQKAHRS